MIGYAHFDVKANLCCERLDLLQVKLDRGIARCIFLKVPEERAWYAVRDTQKSGKNLQILKSQVHTQIDPDTAWDKNSMDDSKVVHDIFRLRKPRIGCELSITRGCSPCQ